VDAAITWLLAVYTAGVGGGASGVDGRSDGQQAQDAGTGGEPAAQAHQHRGLTRRCFPFFLSAFIGRVCLK